MASARIMDGGTNYIEWADDTALDGATECTLGCWVLFDTLADNFTVGIISRWDSLNPVSTDKGILLFLNNTGTAGALHYELLVQASGQYRSVSVDSPAATLFSTDTWYWLVATWDANGGASLVNLYVDGVAQAATPRNTGNPTALTNQAVGPEMGGISAAAGHELKGKIAYGHWYDRALSAEEIQELMYKPGSIQKNLLYYLPLIDDNLADFQGVLGDGTITGSVLATSDGPPVYFPNIKQR